jgi:cullin 1
MMAGGILSLSWSLTVDRLHLGMSYSYYILLYTAIYDFCTQNRSSIGSFGASRGGASLQGADLYRCLHQYLSDHCKKMKEVG